MLCIFYTYLVSILKYIETIFTYQSCCDFAFVLAILFLLMQCKLHEALYEGKHYLLQCVQIGFDFDTPLFQCIVDLVA